VLLALAFALDAYASPGTWIESVDEFIFIAVRLGVLLRGPEKHHVSAAIGLGLLGLAVALINGAVFLHPIVLAILPGTATRVLALTAIGLGLDAAVLGCLFFVETAASNRAINPDLELFPVVAAPHGPDPG
jgi:hypothetical protein